MRNERFKTSQERYEEDQRAKAQTRIYIVAAIVFPPLFAIIMTNLF